MREKAIMGIYINYLHAEGKDFPPSPIMEFLCILTYLASIIFFW
jgi:hypothetical protein